MKVYVIKKYDDDQAIQGMLDIIRGDCPRSEILSMEKTPIPHWKKEAYKKIKEADCAVFFVGKEAHLSENIGWEIKKFIKLNKPIYTIKLDKDNRYHEALYKKTTFGNVEIIDKNQFMHSKEVQLQDLIKIINNNLEFDVYKEVIAHAEINPEVSIEQYKAYLQTSEDVVARRQAVSNFYITVNATLISILSAVVTLINLIGKDYSMIITIVSCYLIPVLGIILCFNWRRLVYSYGQLNAAKMKVISAMEKSLPYNIYDVEWKVQTDKLGKKKYISFTNIEKLIPILFIITYCLILTAAIVLTIIFFI